MTLQKRPYRNVHKTKKEESTLTGVTQADRSSKSHTYQENQIILYLESFKTGAGGEWGRQNGQRK